MKWRDLSTTDSETIKSWWRQWPDSLPGIDLAKIGVVVLDGDRHGGPDGVAGLAQLFKEHNLDTSAIPMVVTLQNGGRHAWFKQPPDLNGSEPLGNRDRAIRDSGINVRGHGGFVVAPGANLGAINTNVATARRARSRRSGMVLFLSYRPRWSSYCRQRQRQSRNPMLPPHRRLRPYRSRTDRLIIRWELLLRVKKPMPIPRCVTPSTSLRQCRLRAAVISS